MHEGNRAAAKSRNVVDLLAIQVSFSWGCWEFIKPMSQSTYADGFRVARCCIGIRFGRFEGDLLVFQDDGTAGRRTPAQAQLARARSISPLEGPSRGGVRCLTSPLSPAMSSNARGSDAEIFTASSMNGSYNMIETLIHAPRPLMTFT